MPDEGVRRVEVERRRRSGRKAFQRPMDEGIEILNAVQDVYLASEITVA